MRHRAFFCRSLVLCVALGVRMGWCQVPGDSTSNPSALRTKENQIWHIFGRVTELGGQPAPQCTVKVAVAEPNTAKVLSQEAGPEPGLTRTVEANLQGEFQTEFSLDPNLYQKLSVELVAAKPGYRETRETVNFGDGGKTWEIALTLRPATQDPDQLSQPDLISSLAPRLRNPAALRSMPASARKDYLRGVGEFLDRHASLRALPFLTKVVDHQPGCVECSLMLGLAQLDAGSWNGATHQFAEAAKLASSAKPTSAGLEPLLVLGVLEEWKGEPKKAAGFLMQALEVSPSDPLMLQELGRVLLLERNWEAADQYLERAIKAGASVEAHLLRVKALLGEGDAELAEPEMKQYLGGREVREFPVPVRALYSELQRRLQLEAYGRVKSMVAQSLSELIRAVPELEGIEAAENQGPLPEILEKVGAGVEAFFHNFPDTISVEDIQQQSLGQNGRVKNSLQQKFSYLLLTRAEKQGLGLEEYREDASGSPSTPQGLKDGFMLTTGFASAALLFHPDYQTGADFRYLGRQRLDGRGTDVVAFAQRPKTARMIERFNADENSVLILVQGLAWVDSTSGELVRMRTDLLKPQPEVRLKRQTTEIQFGEVHFKEFASAFWLPRRVVVTVEWKGKKYRNLHEYSDFRLFKVGTKEKRKAAELASPTPHSPAQD